MLALEDGKKQLGWKDLERSRFKRQRENFCCSGQTLQPLRDYTTFDKMEEGVKKSLVIDLEPALEDLSFIQQGS